MGKYDIILTDSQMEFLEWVLALHGSMIPDHITSGIRSIIHDMQVNGSVFLLSSEREILNTFRINFLDEFKQHRQLQRKETKI